MVGPSIPLQFGANVMLYIDTMMTIISESVADVPPIDVVQFKLSPRVCQQGPFHLTAYEERSGIYLVINIP